MNVKKTKSMVFSRNKDIPKLKLLINGNEIEQVKSFQYLGALVTVDGRCECELNRRIAVAKNNFAKMSRILTDHMSLATKIRLAQCYVWSTLLYGCESWSFLSYPGSFSLPRLGVMARHFFRSRANSAQVLIGSPR